MKDISKKQIKGIKGTFKIVEKKLITPRYLQIIIETSENSELENISAGDKIKFKPYLKDHNEKLNKKNYFNKQIISNVDVKNNQLTIEMLSPFENDTFIKLFMDESVNKVKFISKSAKQSHKHHHKEFCSSHDKYFKKHGKCKSKCERRKTEQK